jgi:hypothetical protein
MMQPLHILSNYFYSDEKLKECLSWTKYLRYIHVLNASDERLGMPTEAIYRGIAIDSVYPSQDRTATYLGVGGNAVFEKWKSSQAYDRYCFQY